MVEAPKEFGRHFCDVFNVSDFRQFCQCCRFSEIRMNFLNFSDFCQLGGREKQEGTERETRGKTQGNKKKTSGPHKDREQEEQGSR